MSDSLQHRGRDMIHEKSPEPHVRSLGQGFNPPEPLERSEEVFPMQKDVFLADMSWDLIPQIQRDENLTRRWRDYAAQRFPKPRKPESVEEGRRLEINKSSLRLSILCANMGQVSCVSKIKSQKIQHHRAQLLQTFLLDNWAHIVAVVEAGGIDAMQDKLKEARLVGLHGHKNQDLVVYARGETAEVSVTAECTSRALVWTAFDVVFGEEKDPFAEEPRERPEQAPGVSRAGKTMWTISVYDIHHDIKWGNLHQDLLDIQRHIIDI